MEAHPDNKALSSKSPSRLSGHVERANSVILQAFRLYCKDKQDDWPEILPSIMMAYRMTPSTQSTQVSPFFLLFGREMHVPIDTALLPKDHLAQDHKIHLTNILRQLETTRKIATENIRMAQERYKHQFDKRSQEPKFQPAERVWLYCTKVAPGKAPKLHRKWTGPYYITQLGPNRTYRIRNCATNKEVKSLINGVRLKPYFDPEDRPTNPPADLIESEEELDGEEIPGDNVHVDRNVVHEQLQQNQAQSEGNVDRNYEQNKTHNAKDRRYSRNKDTQNKAEMVRNGNNAKQQTNVTRGIENRNNRKGSKVNNQTQEKSEVVRNKRVVQNNEKESEQKSKVDKYRVSRQTQEKSQATKSNQGKKTCRNKENIHEKQSDQPQTLNSRRSQSESQPAGTPLPLPGRSQESDESVSKREKLEGQVRQEQVENRKMFSAVDIDRLLSSQRSNGILYYRVKWKQPGSGTTWEYASSIPSMLIREFHASRTMAGKKRKRPLKGKHKFFEKADISSASQDTCSLRKNEKLEENNNCQRNTNKQVQIVVNSPPGSKVVSNVHSENTEIQGNENSMKTEQVLSASYSSRDFDTQENLDTNPKLIGVKLIKGRSYYVIQKGTQEPEYQPVNMAHYHARDFITSLIEQERQDSIEARIEFIRTEKSTSSL